VLGEKLKELGEVIQVSEFKSPIMRFMDMVKSIYFNKTKVSLVLIDTYSTNGFLMAYYSGKICKYLKLPYVPILHGGDLPKRLERSPEKCNEFFNNAAFLVAPSGYMKKQFQSKGYNNVKMIPNQIDINKFKYRERLSAKPNILWVRSFNQIYNPLLAIETLKLVLEKYPEATLCMVGPDKDGSLDLVKEKVKEDGLEAHVRFAGKMTRKEWSLESLNYDIFLNTTNVDNTPLSVMEAMALGMIVVTTNVGGIPFLFENEKEGIMVPPNDADILSQKILEIVSDPAMAEALSKNAREKSKNWDWLFVRELWKKNLAKVK
jgi:glycosyltransferase involved in cell wall biosynthesis